MKKRISQVELFDDTLTCPETSSLRHRMAHPDDIHIVGGGEMMNKGMKIIVLSLS